ncbi:MAG: hypothetical protein ABL871_00105 [Terricaulis sp.]
MTGVVFIFVREDASEAEALAEAFDAAGYSITGTDNAELRVVLWSRRALRSSAFRVAAERALRSGHAIVAGLFAPPRRETVFEAPVVDLTAWDGVDEAALAPLFDAADTLVRPIEADVIVLPFRPFYEDAEFSEAPLMIASHASGRTNTARQAWEAPIPTQMLRPVPDELPTEPKLGAATPRRDFRRINGKPRAREHAALAFAVIALLGGGAFIASLAANTASSLHAERATTEMSSGVSLTSAQAEAVGLEDSVPEAPGQIGHRGVEPPSARTVLRARYEP